MGITNNITHVNVRKLLHNVIMWNCKRSLASLGLLQIMTSQTDDTSSLVTIMRVMVTD